MTTCITHPAVMANLPASTKHLSSALGGDIQRVAGSFMHILEDSNEVLGTIYTVARYRLQHGSEKA